MFEDKRKGVRDDFVSSNIYFGIIPMNWSQHENSDLVMFKSDKSVSDKLSNTKRSQISWREKRKLSGSPVSGMKHVEIYQMYSWKVSLIRSIQKAYVFQK